MVDGYGLSIKVEKRHLVIADGVGRHRRQTRVAKVGHGIRRLVVLGHSGSITFDALRWLDRVGIAFLHLDTDGRILTTSAQPHHDDARLRRAQALAVDTDVALRIVRDLLDAKLAGHARVALIRLDADSVAHDIDQHRQALTTANDIARCREIEATAAATYFAAWHDRVTLRWANNDQARIPDHWRRFDGRRSPLSAGSARNAASPVNAILNYLNALGETECRRACLIMGLDPGLGFLHADTPGRDSLALDLIEVVRPAIEDYFLDIAQSHVFRYADFCERGDGHCRLLAPLTHQLATSLARWEQVVAPAAERVAHVLADSHPRPVPRRSPLTASSRRSAALAGSGHRRKAASGGGLAAPPDQQERSPLGRVCIDCGAPVAHYQRAYRGPCWSDRRRQAGLAGSSKAAAALAAPEDSASRGEAIASGKARARDNAARSLGYPPNYWRSDLGPLVGALSLSEIRGATGLSIAQASRIRRGDLDPHPKYWQALDTLVTAR